MIRRVVDVIGRVEDVAGGCASTLTPGWVARVVVGSEVGAAVRALGPKRPANAVRSEAECPPRDGEARCAERAACATRPQRFEPAQARQSPAPRSRAACCAV